MLNVIGRSPTDIQPVFETIAQSAAHLCEAKICRVFRFDGQLLHYAGSHGVGTEGLEATKSLYPMPPGRGSAAARAVLSGAVEQIPDVEADPEYAIGRGASVIGFRSVAAVPMLKEGRPIGAIAIMRSQAGLLPERQITLLRTFADQAVIAIENARLFEEVQTRNRELRIALEQQTVTSELLKVIGRSTFDLQPVFDTLAENAVRLCEAERALIFRFDGELLRAVATHNVPPELKAFIAEHPQRPGRGSTTARAALEKRTNHVHDIRTDPDYTYGARQIEPATRTMLAIPMLRLDELLGVVTIYRHEVRPFSDRQIALMETFADQAAIAIENTRLFEAEQASKRELARSVEELESLGKVSQAVNSSLELDKVLPTILEHACAMSYAGGGTVYVFDKTTTEFRLAAAYNMSDEHIAMVRAQPIRLNSVVVGECATRREVIQVADLNSAAPSPLLDILLRTGVRAVLAVPLLHQAEVVGVLVVRRNQPGTFSAEVIRLVEAFATQSTIAVENARLFGEIAQKSRELEIASQHKSQFVANMSHELRTPLAAILGYAELIQEGFYGTLPEKSLDALTRIRSNGKHLLGLINTVLDIAKIESGQFSLNLGEYALENVVETVRAATEALAKTKKLALTTEITRQLPIGVGDEQRLTQVLLNLVGNAIKFTDKGEVRVCATAVNSHFAVRVSDTGPGIPLEEQKRIFEKFHQVDSSNTKAKGGTGLGLAITREIVEMHGGRIWVESTLGRGATFQMELPIRAEKGEANL